MRHFLQILKSVPSHIEIVLFVGPETGAFVRGTAHRFNISNLSRSLVGLYGFEGLCFRAPL